MPKENIMSILDGLNVLQGAAGFQPRPPQIPMSEDDQTILKQELMDGNRANVYPNSYDVSRPYSVRIKHNNKYEGFGSFTDVDVATAVGGLCAMSIYKEKAIRGEYDAKKVEAHEEYQAWIADERNAGILKAVQAVAIKMSKVA